MHLLPVDSASPRKGLEQSGYASKAKKDPERWVSKGGKLLSKIFPHSLYGRS